VLERLADSLSALAGAIPSRRDIRPEAGTARVELPIQDLPAHIRFARIWAERSDTFLARRQTRPCHLCGGYERTTWFPTQDGYRYDICERCGMVYIADVVPLPVWDQYFAELPDAREYLRTQMEGTITAAAVEANRTRFGRYFALIRDHGVTLAGARLLDMGTYTGGSLKIAAELGLDARGVEGLEEAVQFCHARRPELRVALGHAEELGPDAFGGRFDLMTMWETLEHTLDPRQALRHARDALAPNGMLAVSVPNARNIQCSMLRDFCFYAYGGYQGVGHINLFTPATLHRALDETGFELVHMETEFGTDWRQVAYYLQHRFERIYCYRNLVRRGEFTYAPEAELAVVLNWLSPAFTSIENALLAGPIAVALARRRER
jgi:2-polyprenyl-3-methyl-5-hydroxy-6-metoxy-1,4-benzoquinol methylase